ncbi:spermidine synthase [Paenibacillus gyeongsangnamensis]|uniref:spermidine synthase n=1 Tax=Paenibacillus gyeongsangnamensis TaxID=3388067 RepID=UPI003907FA6E
MHLLAKEYSTYHEISVYEAANFEGELGRYRWLQFSDDAVQGAIDLSNPKRIVMEYPRAMIHFMEFYRPAFDNVFVIGHGIGTIAGHYPEKRFTVAEIDGKVVELSKAFFGYEKENVMIGDGRRILSEEAPDTFDYIILDAFNKKGTPSHLTTVEFFKMTSEKLRSHGSIMMNLMGKIRNDKLINAIHTTLKEAYAYSKAFCLPGKGAFDIRNILVIGSNNAFEGQPREMAGFVEIELEQGHVIMDSVPRDPDGRRSL